MGTQMLKISWSKEKLEQKIFITTLVTLAILMILNLWTTLKGVKMFGSDIEMNPIARFMLSNIRAFIITKVIYSAITLWVLVKINKWSNNIGHICVGTGFGCYALTILSNLMVIYG